MSVSLRELTEDQTAILAQVESGDFSLDDVADHLDMLDSERKDKIESYLFVINKLTSEAQTVTAEIDRLHAIEKSKVVALERVKSWLLVNMKDGEKFEYPLFKVSRSQGLEVVNINDLQCIPFDYQVCKPESWSVDKREVLKALKAGVKVEGAEITRGNSSLRIK